MCPIKTGKKSDGDYKTQPHECNSQAARRVHLYWQITPNEKWREMLNYCCLLSWYHAMF